MIIPKTQDHPLRSTRALRYTASGEPTIMLVRALAVAATLAVVVLREMKRVESEGVQVMADDADGDQDDAYYAALAQRNELNHAMFARTQDIFEGTQERAMRAKSKAAMIRRLRKGVSDIVALRDGPGRASDTAAQASRAVLELLEDYIDRAGKDDRPDPDTPRSLRHR